MEKSELLNALGGIHIESDTAERIADQYMFYMWTEFLVNCGVFLVVMGLISWGVRALWINRDKY
tara:strand:+ start:3525 stop:3716 length:192 start_codon:yes stop_codon:yes gene_type:complete